MATVTVFTATRTLAVENSSIVSGAINGDGDLILTTKGGSTINAGNTVGEPRTGYSTPTPNTFVERDSSGRTQVTNPVSDNDVANKAYVDAEITSTEGYVDNHVWDGSDITTGTISNERLPGITQLSSEEIRLSSNGTITTTLTAFSGFSKTMSVEEGDIVKILGFFNYDPADNGVLTIIEARINGDSIPGESHSQGIRATTSQGWIYTVPSAVSSVTITFAGYHLGGADKSLFANHTKMLVEHFR